MIQWINSALNGRSPGAAWTTQSVLRSGVSHSARALASANSVRSPKNLSCPARCKAMRPLTSNRRSSSVKQMIRGIICSAEPRQHAHMQKEPWFARDPPGAVRGQATAWNDHVDMRVMGQRRSPGVEDAGHADASAKTFGIPAHARSGDVRTSDAQDKTIDTRKRPIARGQSSPFPSDQSHGQTDTPFRTSALLSSPLRPATSTSPRRRTTNRSARS